MIGTPFAYSGDTETQRATLRDVKAAHLFTQRVHHGFQQVDGAHRVDVEVDETLVRTEVVRSNSSVHVHANIQPPALPAALRMLP